MGVEVGFTILFGLLLVAGIMAIVASTALQLIEIKILEAPGGRERLEALRRSVNSSNETPLCRCRHYGKNDVERWDAVVS